MTMLIVSSVEGGYGRWIKVCGLEMIQSKLKSRSKGLVDTMD